MNFKVIPTAKEIKEFVKDFPAENPYDHQNYSVSLELVQSFFSNSYPNIFVKVNYINGAFKTGIGDTMGVALNIHLNVKKLDKRLKGGDKSLVDEIAAWKSKKSKAKRNNHSFATKYCHCHYPELFPINDQYVRYSLLQFNKKARFSSFKEKEIKYNYDNFCSMLDSFNSVIGGTLDYKTLDRYLWALARPILKKKAKARAKKREETKLIRA
jgi:hypothetical protein